MLFSSAVLLASDAVAWGFRGSPGSSTRHMVLISNFLVFLFNDILLLIYHGYVCCWIFEKDPEEKRKNRRVNTVYAICAAAILLVCISQITHLYYYIDTQNYYYRNPSIISPFYFLYWGCCWICPFCFSSGRTLPTESWQVWFPILSCFCGRHCFDLLLRNIPDQYLYQHFHYPDVF